MSDGLISLDDAAIELGVSKAAIWKWIRQREIPTFRVLGNRRTLIKTEDVARLREPMPITDTKKAAA